MSYSFEQDMDRSYMLGRLKGGLDIAIKALEKVTDPDCSDWSREFERDCTLKVLQELQADVEAKDAKLKEELGV